MAPNGDGNGEEVEIFDPNKLCGDVDMMESCPVGENPGFGIFDANSVDRLGGFAASPSLTSFVVLSTIVAGAVVFPNNGLTGMPSIGLPAGLSNALN